MKNITKLGLSALCGSLAAVSAANAGTLDVTGSAHITHTQLDGAVTGNPLGMKSNMSFIGAGELDGGQTFTLTIVHNDKAAWSAADIVLNTNSLGSFTISQGNGSALSAYDDATPTAWEEVWDTGTGAGLLLQNGVGSTNSLKWTTPAGPGGTKLILAYAPQNDGTTPTDKATGGLTNDGLYKKGYDIVLDIAPDSPINLYAGYHKTELDKEVEAIGGTSINRGDDHQQAIVGLKLSLGPLVIGGQASAESLEPSIGVGSEVEYYGNTAWGVALNVNDDLSISYGEARSIQSLVGGHTDMFATDSSKRFQPKSRMSGSAIQIAYAIGGVSFKFADSSWDNSGYSGYASGKAPKDARTFAMALAF